MQTFNVVAAISRRADISNDVALRYRCQIRANCWKSIEPFCFYEHTNTYTFRCWVLHRLEDFFFSVVTWHRWPTYDYATCKRFEWQMRIVALSRPEFLRGVLIRSVLETIGDNFRLFDYVELINYSCQEVCASEITNSWILTYCLDNFRV